MLRRAVLPLLSSWLLLAATMTAAEEGEVSDGAGAEEVNRSAMLTAAAPPDPLRRWLEGLVIPLPAGATGELPMGMGSLELTAGSCWDIRIGHLQSEDNSVDQLLRFAVNVTDFEIKCHVEGLNNGTLEVNVTMGRSSIEVGVQIEPYVSPVAPFFPLPFGQFNKTHCMADLVVQHIEFAGDSLVNQALQGLPVEMLIPMMGSFINDPLCEGLRDVIEVQVNSAAQLGAQMVTPLLFDPFPLLQPEPLKPLMNLSTYPPLKVAQALVRERFHLWTDRVVEILSVTSFESTLLDTPNVSLTLRDFQIQGIGARTHPGLEIGALDQLLDLFVDLKGLSLYTSLGLDLKMPGQPELTEVFDITLGLNNLSMALRAWVDESMLNGLEIDQVMQSPRCIVQCSSSTADPPSDSIAVEKMEVAMRPLLEVRADGSLERDITVFFNSVVAALYNGYMPTINTLVNGALGIARTPLNSLMWQRIDALPQCSRAELFMGVDEHVIRSLWVSSICIALLGAAAGAAVHFRKRAPEDETCRPAEVTQIASAQDSSLARQSFVPPALAVFYPFAVVSVMLLFLFADLDLGATVSVVMAAEGRSATIGPLFSFSLLGTIVHSWESGAYFISVLTLLTSGIWPFVKLNLLLACWLLPPSRFSARRRGHVLNFLNTWGKYSFVDSWFLVLSMSAFALEWQSVGDASMKVQTTPTAAFYAFFSATSLSLVLGHVASELHARAIKATAVGGAGGAGKAAAVDDEGEARPLSCFVGSRILRVTVACALALAATLAVVGTFLVSFDFQVDGIAMEFLFGRRLSREYSLLGIGTSVAQDRYQEAGLLGLEVVFLALCVVVPILELGVLMVLWMAPLRPLAQSTLVHICYLLDSWSSLDVAALVLVIATSEFGRMAEFLVYKSGFAAPCSMIKDLTASECLEVHMHARGCMAIVILAGMLLLVLPKVMLRLCVGAVSRRTGSPAPPPKEIVGIEECNPVESSTIEVSAS